MAKSCLNPACKDWELVRKKLLLLRWAALFTDIVTYRIRLKSQLPIKAIRWGEAGVINPSLKIIGIGYDVFLLLLFWVLNQ